MIGGILRKQQLVANQSILLGELQRDSTPEALKKIDFQKYVFQPAPKEQERAKKWWSQRFNPDIQEHIFTHILNTVAGVHSQKKYKSQHTHMNITQYSQPLYTNKSTQNVVGDKFATLRRRVDDQSNETVENIVKVRLNNYDILNGQIQFDYRLSQSLEVPT